MKIDSQPTSRVEAAAKKGITTVAAIGAVAAVVHSSPDIETIPDEQATQITASDLYADNLSDIDEVRVDVPGVVLQMDSQPVEVDNLFEAEPVDTMSKIDRVDEQEQVDATYEEELISAPEQVESEQQPIEELSAPVVTAPESDISNTESQIVEGERAAPVETEPVVGMVDPVRRAIIEVDFDDEEVSDVEIEQDTLDDSSGEIPSQIAEILERDTVYISGLGCSGLAVRGEDDSMIGVITTEHCSITSQDRPRTLNENGELSIDVSLPWVIQQETDTKGQKEALDVTVTSMVVPPTGDNTEDYALLVLDNNDPHEVYSAAATDAPLPQQGDTAWLSAFPAEQENNPMFMNARQEWAMTYLGQRNLNMRSGERYSDVLIFAMKKNADGATCSFGASGANALNDAGDSHGALAAFTELKPGVLIQDQESADRTRRIYERYFGVDLSEFDTICGFVKQPDIESMEIVQVNNPVEGTAESDVIGLFRESLDGLLDDAETPARYINGTVMVPTINKFGHEESVAVQNPFYNYDEAGNIIMFWPDSDRSKYLTGYAYATIESNQLLPYIMNPDSDEYTSELTGAVSYENVADLTQYTDATGVSVMSGSTLIGELHDHEIAVGDDGVITVVPWAPPPK